MPVVATSAMMLLSPLQRSVRRFRASGSEAFSKASGRRAQTRRRASVRLSRAVSRA